MKAARLKQPGQVVLEDIPVPQISEYEVLLEVKYCGICGTDSHGVAEAPGFYKLGTYLGHEFSAVIARVGGSVEGWNVGDRVVVNPMNWCGECYACKHGFLSQCSLHSTEVIGGSTDKTLPGGFAQFVRVPKPQYRLWALPEGLSFQRGALAEPLACSLHAIRVSTFTPGDYSLVLGAGPVGLGVVAFLKYSGAGLIVVTEVNNKRAEVARRFGADYVFNPIEVSDLRERVLDITSGQGVNQVFECSGTAQAFQSAPDFLKPRGQIVMVGLIQHEIPILPFRYQPGEFQIQSSWCTTDEWPLVLDFLRRTETPVEQMITSVIRLEDIIERGFNRLLQPNNGEI
jgi:threonine dehydrogenase-like Zn-dependent dehydrogenase